MSKEKLKRAREYLNQTDDASKSWSYSALMAAVAMILEYLEEEAETEEAEP